MGKTKEGMKNGTEFSMTTTEENETLVLTFQRLKLTGILTPKRNVLLGNCGNLPGKKPKKKEMILTLN